MPEMSLLDQVQLYLRGESVAAVSYPPDGTARFALICFVILVQLFLAGHVLAGIAARRPGEGPAGRALRFFRRFPGVVAADILVIILFFALWEGAIGAYIGRVQHGAKGNITRTHPTLLWRYVPGTTFEQGGVIYEINSMGLRDREIPLKKGKDELRILSMGDSWTFGQGVALEETFSKQLEEMLSARLPGRKITVINAGIQGYSYMQGYFLLRETSLKYGPDLLLINSFNHTFSREYLFERVRFSESPFLQWLQMQLLKLNCYLVMRAEIIKFSSLAWRGKTPPARDPTVTSEEARMFIQKLIDLARAQKINILFVSQPLKDESWTHWSQITPQLDCASSPACRISFLDLKPEMLRTNPGKFFLKSDPFHCTAAAHREIAQILLEKILREGLLGGGR
jgi:lysophospholipase L1-like esterase